MTFGLGVLLTVNALAVVDERVAPWNKGKLIGQKPPLKLKEIWAIRIRLQLDHRAGTRVVQSRHRQQVARVRPGGASRPRCVPGQSCRPTRDCHAEEDPGPVASEITEQTREAVGDWIVAVRLKPEQFLFPSRMSASPHLSTRQYCWDRSYLGGIDWA